MCTLLLIAALAACAPPLAPAQGEMVRRAYFRYAVFYYETPTPEKWELKPAAEAPARVSSRNLRLASPYSAENPDAGPTVTRAGLSYGIVRADVSTLRGRDWRPGFPIEQRQRSIFGVSFTLAFPVGR